MPKHITAAALSFGLVAGLAACEDEESVGEKVGEAVEEAGDEIEDTAEKAEDGLDN